MGRSQKWESFRTGSLDKGVVDGRDFWKAFKRGQMRQNAVQALGMITAPASASTRKSSVIYATILLFWRAGTV